jgi:hypothetical protein
MLAFSGSAIAAWPEPAWAAEITWDAPAGCPERDAVRWRVEEALGMPLSRAAALKFAAKIEQRSQCHAATPRQFQLDCTQDRSRYFMAAAR